ncbi:MAG: DUF3090 family protein [Chloroflexi bacterium]|nr:DUF3090 family protein [Chloroflexota bacterium]
MNVESNKVKYSLGAVTTVEAVTLGEPGRRTFRVDARAGSANCSVWMEKEQLQQLGVYLRDMVGRLSQEDRDRNSDLREDGWSGDELTVDFKAGQMLLSYDQDSNAFYLQAYERETVELLEEEAAQSREETAPDNEENTELADTESVGFWITTAQAIILGEESLKICAAGRPTCFLCGQPISPEGHACPRANGHTVLEAG